MHYEFHSVVCTACKTIALNAWAQWRTQEHPVRLDESTWPKRQQRAGAQSNAHPSSYQGSEQNSWGKATAVIRPGGSKLRRDVISAKGIARLLALWQIWIGSNPLDYMQSLDHIMPFVTLCANKWYPRMPWDGGKHCLTKKNGPGCSLLLRTKDSFPFKNEGKMWQQNNENMEISTVI